MGQHLLNTNKAKMEILTGPKSRNLKVMGYREEIVQSLRDPRKRWGKVERGEKVQDRDFTG